MTRYTPLILLFLSVLAGSALAAQPFDDLWNGRYSGQVQATIDKSGPDSFRVDLRIPGKRQCHINLDAAPESSGMSLYLVHHRQVACTVHLERSDNQLVVSQDRTCRGVLPPDCTFNGRAARQH